MASIKTLNCKSIKFECRFLKSKDGVLYGAEYPLSGAFNWRAECLHPHYHKLIFAYARTQSKAHVKLFDKWCYLLNRGTAYPRSFRSSVCGDISTRKVDGVWQATSKHPVNRSHSLTAYAPTVEAAIERLENAYRHIVRCTVSAAEEKAMSADPIYERLVRRGYTDAEYNGEPGDNGDSLHKPGLTKAKLDEELDNIHYRMVCVRMSRKGKAFLHADIGCCDPERVVKAEKQHSHEDLPINAPQLTTQDLDWEFEQYRDLSEAEYNQLLKGEKTNLPMLVFSPPPPSSTTEPDSDGFLHDSDYENDSEYDM